MISFIIIGKNEGWKLDRCLQNIQKVVLDDSIGEYEIIYVDSGSSDSSVNLALSFKSVKVYSIIGNTNAALGRNIGASEAKGDVLFFMDGDMELNSGVLPLFYQNGKLSYPFISANFENHYYTNNWEFLNKEPYYPKLTEDTYMAVTGGLFLIEKHLFEELNGMRTRFVTGEDFDLGLRMAKKGILLLRKKELLVKHHTINYKSFSRSWTDLFNGKTLYSRGVLYRHHLFNKHLYSKLIKADPTAIFLALVTVVSAISGIWEIFFLYFIGLSLILLLLTKIKSILGFFNRFVFQILRDIATIFAFFIFYPKDKKPNYKIIRD